MTFLCFACICPESVFDSGFFCFSDFLSNEAKIRCKEVFFFPHEENIRRKNGGCFMNNANATAYEAQKQKGKFLDTKKMVIISMFGALSYVLMLVHLPIKYLGFLEMEFSDVPAIVATIAYGPIVGIFIELIKNVIKVLTASTTGGTGELANFIVSVGYILPLGLVYHGLKTKRKLLLSCIAAVVGMVVTAIFVNYFITVPLYASLFGGQEVVIGVCAKTVPAIKSLAGVVILGITPFNIVKGILMSVVGVLCYSAFGKVLTK